MAVKKVEDVKLFDVRAIERNLKKGYITSAQYNKFLKSLPDASENGGEFDMDQSAVVVEREARRLAREEALNQEAQSVEVKAASAETDDASQQ